MDTAKSVAAAMANQTEAEALAGMFKVHRHIPGELLLYDGKRLELERVPVERSPGCSVCGT